MKISHIAIICSDYEKSKYFYIEILGFNILGEVYSPIDKFYKVFLTFDNTYIIELLFFSDFEKNNFDLKVRRVNNLTFSVKNIRQKHKELSEKGLECTEICINEFIGGNEFSVQDPDDLLIKFYKKKRSFQFLRILHHQRKLKFGVIDVLDSRAVFKSARDSIKFAILLTIFFASTIGILVAIVLSSNIYRKELLLFPLIILLLFPLMSLFIKIYEKIFPPILILKFDKFGIHFQDIKIDWRFIRKVRAMWDDNDDIVISILTKDNKVIEKVVSSEILEYNMIYEINSFRKKYRRPYQFNLEKKNI